MNSGIINNQSPYFIKALVFKERVQMKELQARSLLKMESTESSNRKGSVFFWYNICRYLFIVRHLNCFTEWHINIGEGKSNCLKLFQLLLTKENAKECSNYCIIALISHTSKVMLKSL